MAIIGTACGVQYERYEVQGLTFDAPSGLDIVEYTLDLERGVFHKGPSSYDQGVMVSSDNNFMVEWVYAPEFTQELARIQAQTGPAFFEGSAISARTVGSTKVESINGLSVTSAELSLRWSGGEASGVIGVWQCLPSQRAINFIAIHSDPQDELNRTASSFGCS